MLGKRAAATRCGIVRRFSSTHPDTRINSKNLIDYFIVASSWHVIVIDVGLLCSSWCWMACQP